MVWSWTECPVIVSLRRSRKLLQLSSIEHVQRTIRKNKAFSDTSAFSFVPAIFSTCSAVDVYIHSNIGQARFLAGEQLCGDSVDRSQSFQDAYGKAAKRLHSAGLKNTEQETPKRKERQCLRAELELDVRISQAEAKVYAPLGSCAWPVRTARAAWRGLLPADDGHICASVRDRDHVVFARATHT